MKSYLHSSTMTSGSLKYPVWKGQISPEQNKVQPSLTPRQMPELLQTLLYAIHMLSRMIHSIIDIHANTHTWEIISC